MVKPVSTNTEPRLRKCRVDYIRAASRKRRNGVRWCALAPDPAQPAGANGIAPGGRMAQVSEDISDDINPLQDLLDEMDVALADLDAAWQTTGTQTGLAGSKAGLSGELNALAARSVINRADDVHTLLGLRTGATVTGRSPVAWSSRRA